MNHKLKYLALPLCLLLLLTPACSKREGIGAGSGGASPSVNGGGSSSSSSGGGGNAGGARVISADDKPLDVMTKAMRAQLDAKSYRAHVNTSLSDGTNNAMVIEYVAPDRYHMTGEGQGGGAGKNFKMEYVVIGSASYIKVPNSGWVKSPVDASSIIKGFRDPKMLDELAKTADVKFVGPETLDGAPMLVYQYTQNDVMGMKLKSTSKTWLSVADGLPRKTETEGEYAGKKTKTLVTISDYNADIKIESPVK